MTAHAMMHRRETFSLLAAVIVVMLACTAASAHSDLVSSAPASGETLSARPGPVILVFKKEMQAVSMNSIEVTAQDGRRVDKETVVLSDDRKQLRVDLDEGLISGTYTVQWRALSADDHTIKGKFTFTVALPVEGNAATAAAPTAQPSSNDKMRMDHQMPAQESGTNLAQSAVRWLVNLAMMTLFGGFAFRLLVLKPSLSQAADLSDEERSLGFVQGEDRFIRLTWLGLALLAFAAVASLILQTSSVMDVSMSQGFAPSRLFQVLTETSYGKPWLLQIAVMLALGVIVFFIARRRKDLTAKAPLLWIGLILCAALFLTPSLTGHARAAASEYRFAIVSDWLHLIGVGVWVGGLFHLALTMPKSITHLQSVGRLCVVSQVIPLFSRAAIAATIIIMLTGVYNSWIHVESFSALWTTPYGQVLSVKIILFLPMLALGGLNTFVLRRHADHAIDSAASGSEHRAVDRSFYRSVRIEAAIGAAVLLVAAVLAFLPPARQHDMQMMMNEPVNDTRPTPGIGEGK